MGRTHEPPGTGLAWTHTHRTWCNYDVDMGHGLDVEATQDWHGHTPFNPLTGAPSPDPEWEAKGSVARDDWELKFWAHGTGEHIEAKCCEWQAVAARMVL
jgi:hypothetical protein